MVYTILLVVLVIDAVLLIGTILLQAGKGSGLAANFGGASSSPDAFIGIRQAGTILTKATWWCAGLFLGLAFTLQIMSTRTQAPKSVLEDTFGRPATTAPATTPNTAAPAVPLSPAPGSAGATAPATSPLTLPAPAAPPPAAKK
ncbi:MAG: preprotein translocase subunit SecG [Gemmatimonadales bacterium]